MHDVGWPHGAWDGPHDQRAVDQPEGASDGGVDCRVGLAFFFVGHLLEVRDGYPRGMAERVPNGEAPAGPAETSLVVERMSHAGEAGPPSVVGRVR